MIFSTNNSRMNKPLYLYILLLSVCVVTTDIGLCAQNLPTNFGLTEPQPTATLPCSRSAQQKSCDIHPVKALCDNELFPDNEILIPGKWKMASEKMALQQSASPLRLEFDTSDWYDATVPGTVLTTLVDNGVFPDPYWGLNNIAIPDSLCRTQWWYRTEFLTPKQATDKHVQLLFNGINYRADIWLNGHFVGKITGAFIRGVFDVDQYLVPEGLNVLAVKVYPPNNPGIPHEQSTTAGVGPNGGQLCLDGPTFISSEGWDWIPGIRDRNTGLWQDVRLRFSGDIEIFDPQIVTDLPLPDTTSANITARAVLRNRSNLDQNTTVTFKFNNITVSKKVYLPSKSEAQIELTPDEFPSLRIKNPHLWWPNGYGEAFLYSAVFGVETNGVISDHRNIRFGIRELSYDLTVKDQDGIVRDINFNPIDAYAAGIPVLDMLDNSQIEPSCEVSIPRLLSKIPSPGIKETKNSATPYLTIRVNGKKIFIRGGNWGMDDGMKRVSRERLEPYIRLHRDQHFNMIRNWTGESTEELFYDLCDEYGILVFNDFSLSTEGYNLNPNDNILMLQNAEDIITRYRNHPSIAVWCPRNEGFAPEYLDRGFSQAIAKLDGTRYYSGSSISLNMAKSGPWGFRHPSENFKSNISRGFTTELGTISVPTVETMRRMMAEEDLWPIGDVWSYHDFHSVSWLAFDQLVPYMDKTYGTSENVDDFCRKSQLLNYDAYRSIFEAFNSRMWHNTTGVLLWMSHPAWPSVVWQTYSFDYETPAAYFGSMKACEPFHPQIRPDDNRIQLVNIGSRDIPSKLRCEVYDINGHRLYKDEIKCIAKAEYATECFTLDTSSFPSLYLLRLVAINRESRESIINDYWRTQDGGDFTALETLSAPDLHVVSLQKKASGRYELVLANKGDSIALSVKLNIWNKSKDQVLLPAYFSDGYFTMLPGEQRTIWIEFAPTATNDSLCILAHSYNGEQCELCNISECK